jgi:hypothetical protein
MYPDDTLAAGDILVCRKADVPSRDIDLNDDIIENEKIGEEMTLREELIAYEAQHGEITEIETMRSFLDELENREWWKRWEGRTFASKEDACTGIVDVGSSLTTYAGISRHDPTRL